MLSIALLLIYTIVSATGVRTHVTHAPDALAQTKFGPAAQNTFITSIMAPPRLNTPSCTAHATSMTPQNSYSNHDAREIPIKPLKNESGIQILDRDAAVAQAVEPADYICKRLATQIRSFGAL